MLLSNVRKIAQQIEPYFSIFLLFITCCVLFVQIVPGMPSPGLDPSWVTAMNIASAEKMKFGSEFIFTFGPYASVYSKEFHPDLYLGTIIVEAILLISVFLSLYVGTTKHTRLITTLLIAINIPFTPDASFFFIPVLFSYSSTQYLTKPNQAKYIGILLLLISLGIIPLIKVSFLFLSLLTCGIISVLFFLKKKYPLAVSCIILPPISFFIFWRTSGQSIQDVYPFIKSTIQIISGYSEAMSGNDGNKIETIYYIMASLLLLINIYRAKQDWVTRAALITTSAASLLIVFKAGFTRHDTHALTAGGFLILIAILNYLANSNLIAKVIIILAIATQLNYQSNHGTLSAQSRFHDIYSYYLTQIMVPRDAIRHIPGLSERFEKAKIEIRKVHEIPSVPGTSDIYFFNAAHLLATNNRWNPRPVFQSYSAYTPELIKMNERHLRNTGAPDNIFFHLETIDRRIPSLDDGLSWPAIIDNYIYVSEHKDYIQLKRNRSIIEHSSYNEIFNKNYSMGATIDLPRIKNPLFLTITAAQNPLGKILNTLFKIPTLSLKVEMANGKIFDYVIPSNMTSTGFFISPLITSNHEFILLMNNQTEDLKDQSVKSIALTVEPNGKWFWHSEFNVTLKEYLYPPNQ